LNNDKAHSRGLSGFTEQYKNIAVYDKDILKQEITDNLNRNVSNATIFSIGKGELQECPHVEVSVGNRKIISLIDTGAEISVISQELFEKLMEDGIEIPTLPISNCLLEAAFGTKSQRIKRQALLNFTIDGSPYEAIALISPRLTMYMILGVDFFREYRVTICLDEVLFTSRTSKGVTRHKFSSFLTGQIPELTEKGVGELNNSTIQVITAGSKGVNICPETFTDGISEDNTFLQKNEELGNRGINIEGGSLIPAMMNNECLYDDDEYDVVVDVRAMIPIDLQLCNMYVSPEGGRISYARYDAENKQKLNCVGPGRLEYVPKLNKPDERSVAIPELHQNVNEAKNLDDAERRELFNLLHEYKEIFTSKPGRFKYMKYKFEMENEEAIVSTSRAIPFALHYEVRSTIEQMLEDDIIEPSVSCYLNPITVIPRPGKSVRIYLDARRVNRHMRPDRTCVSPIAELLQQFHGSNFISTIDLSSAFIQVELAHECRKFTAFLFENQVYQFKRVPYGLRNSLAGFIRALNIALGPDTLGYVLSYVDDITVHSKNFDDHLKHLRTVFEELTSA
jgi:hypothetical protein